MQESPSASTGVSSSASAASPTATEIVTRPEPGLARGKWEAPEWFFWAALAGIVLGSTAYLLRRLGMLRLRSAKGQPQDALPPSSRARRP